MDRWNSHVNLMIRFWGYIIYGIIIYIENGPMSAVSVVKYSLNIGVLSCLVKSKDCIPIRSNYWSILYLFLYYLWVNVGWKLKKKIVLSNI